MTRASFPGGDIAPNPGELRVAFDKTAYAALIGHAVLEPEVEVCGVLVGKRLEDGHGSFLQIVGAIRGESARQGGAQVTFTHETWEHIHRVLEKEYQGQEIVGWYHTHGGFGIFLSEMDTFVHQNFFGGPHQIAYVFDPLAGSEGVFVSCPEKAAKSGMRLVQLDRFWVGGRVRARLPEAPVSETPSLGGSGDLVPLVAAVKQMAATLARREKGGFFELVPWLGCILLGAMLCFALVVGAPLERLQSTRMVIVEQDPVSGKALGLPLTELAGVKADVFMDRAGTLHAGLSLSRDDDQLVLTPLVGRPGAPAPEPTTESGWRHRALVGAGALVALAGVGGAFVLGRRGRSR